MTAACTSADDPSPRVSEQPPISAGEGAPTPSGDAPQIIGGVPQVTLTSQRDVATGLDVPWSMAFRPDGGILVSERDAGRILRIGLDGAATALTGPGAQDIALANDSQGEAGLLGIVLHPDDPSLLYAYQTRPDGNAVLRMALNGDSLSTPTVILGGIPKARNHDGGRLAFGPDGYLYVSTGDAGNGDLAQDKESLAGKILRIVADGSDADGQAAPGNPFESPVWTHGHRNVQGMGWVADGRMYATEFGQNSTDEINLIVPGRNYGWPIVEARDGAPDGTESGQTVDGLTYPVVEWATDDASPSGMAVTQEGLYVGALRGERVWRVPLTADGLGSPQVLLDGLGRIRNVAVGPDGGLYLITSNTDGRGDLREGDDRLVRLTVS
ncbi:MAG: glucose sorbosone dehydrogenase [Actinobacteria bacterium HGW-Actinobacteria-8]|nr:MAG: glucose sorbosone dehydrogenase [Actinobacteria bacterium HGW-Actinobacteria-8]